MQSDPLFWHRTLDRRQGIVIPFPPPRRHAPSGDRLPPHQAARWIACLIVGMWVLAFGLVRALVTG